ncbi:GFA family protein [Sandarakinorhabdus sp. DWP1-3-1]|uniref:GFA family protein n=1 Tax=Sandarakinorhabdus sp. DWP1-3-1 TaxID=2804627 RepID=UPI003CFB69DA
MSIRTATCRCGQLSATCTGEPVRVSVCHCRNCQRRSGSAFSLQARWPDAQVELAGSFREWQHLGDSGSCATFRFCPECGSTLVYASTGLPGLTAVAVGGFADPSFPPPHYSVYESRKHGWVAITGDAIEHFD